MTKREIAKELQEIMTGASGHTNAIVWKEGRSWKIETGLNKFDHRDYGLDSINYRHCCNEITIQEIIENLTEKFDPRNF